MGLKGNGNNDRHQLKRGTVIDQSTVHFSLHRRNVCNLLFCCRYRHRYKMFNDYSSKQEKVMY